MELLSQVFEIGDSLKIVNSDKERMPILIKELNEDKDLRREIKRG